eukprot:TRINITY_DN7532_c0_g2_i3.p1 TRINITY_DN7532_c0_g2~~TRINITY_DN7532_c0_g2_i3.p1  ORF type:complete len:268 (+),score=39.53 TRINITY_DN7532_c0_g2_i3:68-805(+)
MFSAVRSGARRVQHSLTTPVERGRRVTAMGLAASGAVYLYVLTRCGYHTIVHADTGSGDLWNSGVIPAGIAGSVLMVTTVWAVLFTGMAVSSGFSWGHVHHARDNAFLLYHYPCDAKRRAAILEWIHFADLTAQNQHDYHDLYTDTRRRPPVRFVPDPREFKDMDLQETSITGEELVTCPEDEKRLASLCMRRACLSASVLRAGVLLRREDRRLEREGYLLLGAMRHGCRRTAAKDRYASQCIHA